ncbi:MAG: TolC family protein [Deltaproteobacteria bacterium]|nr:TolC family protein [Deltaproteobacteria bacterium]
MKLNVRFVFLKIITVTGALLCTVAFSSAENLASLEEGSRGRVQVEVADLVENRRNDAVRLSLKLALGIALENNLSIQIEKIKIPLSEKVTAEKEARFDPAFFGEALNRRYEQQASSALIGTPVLKENQQHAKVGVRKLFRCGLEAESYIESSRYRNNSAFEGLDPQYKNLFVLTLRQPLLENLGSGINTSDIKIAQNDIEIAKNIFRSQVIATLGKVEKAYYDLSNAQSVLALREESFDLAKTLLADNQKRFAAGMTHIGEVQEAETAVASREEQLIHAQQTVKDLTTILKNILQIQPHSPLYPLMIKTEEPLPDDQEIPTHGESLAAALVNRPDYSLKKTEVGNKDILVNYRKNQLLPRLDLVGALGLNGLSGKSELISFAGESGKNPYGGSVNDSWDYLLDGEGYEWSVGLMLEIPLGNRADRSRYDQSLLDKNRSLLQLKHLEDAIDMEIRLALEAIRSSNDRIEVAERFVRLARITLDQEEERLKAGLSNTFRVLNFQDDFIEANIRKVNALVDYKKAVAHLYEAMGTNLDRHDMYVSYQDKARAVQ